MVSDSGHICETGGAPAEPARRQEGHRIVLRASLLHTYYF